MKVTILQENLNKGFSIVSRVVSSKITLPILSNILISAEENRLKLTATNLETGINVWLPAKIEKDGKFTIPSKDITEFISSLPSGKIKLEKKEEKLQITSGKYSAVFNGISAAEFPFVPNLKSKKTLSNIIKKIKLDKKELLKSVSSVCFSAAIDETRPVLTGVRFSCIKNKLQMVATDGYRLSLKDLKLKDKIDISTIIIPVKALNEVIKSVGIWKEEDNEEKLNMAITKKENQIIFSFNNIEIVTRLIDGEFPDFSKIIPEKGESKALIDREEFSMAIRTASIFARKSANIVRLKFTDQKLNISSNAPEIGKNEIEMSIRYKGKEVEIAFNYRFLQDFLNSFDSEVFSLELSGSLKPGLFKVENDPSYLHVIMPVRLQK